MASYSWLPETCRVILPIKLEFSASVGFVHFNNLNANKVLAGKCEVR
jgi:hypothetical protein